MIIAKTSGKRVNRVFTALQLSHAKCFAQPFVCKLASGAAVLSYTSFQLKVGVWDMKPLVDGNAMKEIFRNIPKGKAFTELMDAQKEWMLEHQEGTREQLVTHLTQEFQDFL
uniref:Uncharacterized protein n=1 Tax=Heterosigma akashiwo TaxID=2829 RepID=A0A7S3XWV3_HETAK